MCGRFLQKSKAELIALKVGVKTACIIKPRYNIAPGASVVVIRDTAGELSFVEMRWGLKPTWDRGQAGEGWINARRETLAAKPAFREAYRQRRCVVPADGFYEWRKEGRTKQPYCARRRDGQPFLMAGLWEPATSGPLPTFAIVTTEATESIKHIHHRMPLILAAEAAKDWLNPNSVASVDARAGPALQVYAVSPLVNSPANDDPRCIEPVQGQTSLFD